MITQPALFGGPPEFASRLPMVQPAMADFHEFLPGVEEMLISGMLTNNKNVACFEERCADYLGVKYVIAVSSCTTGLMLVLKCLELTGDLLIPGFTFSATAHAAVWNGLTPVFVDCNDETFNVTAETVKAGITDDTGAILAVHVFGNPCEIAELEKAAHESNIPLVFDAAHAFGGEYPGKRMVGTGGIAEIFSLSPTKVLVAGEGGLISTNNEELANKLRLARNYGNNAHYDCFFPGMNGRMAEFNAILGLANFKHFNSFLQKREELAARLKEKLNGLPGISFQKILPEFRNVYKDLAIKVEAGEFGLKRDELALYLDRENIDSRKYFYPAAHRLSAYKSLSSRRLAAAENLSAKILCLPLFSQMSFSEMDRIGGCIEAAYQNRQIVRKFFDKN